MQDCARIFEFRACRACDERSRRDFLGRKTIWLHSGAGGSGGTLVQDCARIFEFRARRACDERSRRDFLGSQNIDLGYIWLRGVAIRGISAQAHQAARWRHACGRIVHNFLNFEPAGRVPNQAKGCDRAIFGGKNIDLAFLCTIPEFSGTRRPAQHYSLFAGSVIFGCRRLQAPPGWLNRRVARRS